MAEVAVAVTVTLAPVLMRLFPGCPHRVALEAATVAAVIDQLEGRWPGMRDRLCDSTPRIRRHVNVFVDGARAALETSLRPGAEIFIVTAISGG
ncbi:MAG TPA: MoaD/ThiS family protein [Stellaceae bacterium]|nr:MoaD/ThiS family protein [Stellaceae bacterium]